MTLHHEPTREMLDPDQTLPGGPMTTPNNVPQPPAVPGGFDSPPSETQPYVSTPETTDTRKKSHKIATIISGLAASGAIIAGAFMFGRSTGDEGETVKQETPTTIEGFPGPAPEPSPKTEVPTITDVEDDITTGNLHINRILPDEPTITAQRPNGETIAVPYLRVVTDDPKSLVLFEESIFALMSCYITTGNEECLTAFSTDEKVQQQLKEIRETSFLPILEGTSDENLQLAIYDDPNNPMRFSLGHDIDGNNRAIIAEGRTYFNITSDAQWQSPKTHELNSSYLIQDLIIGTSDPAKSPVTITSLELTLTN